MAFFMSVLWALLAFGTPQLSHGAGMHAAPVSGHQHHGGMHVMDGTIGGPAVG